MKINNSEKSYKLLRRIASLESEALWVIGLNKKLNLINYQCLKKGKPFSCEVPVNLVIQFILNTKANYFILIHNHPDGSLFPSDQDINATQVFKTVGEFLGIPLLDHIIIGKNAYKSFLDEAWFEF